jgi:3-oxoacyl-[acyl-carrier-protein] synthase-1/3-oxoacyl-[acyl-carrier-protein] synthase II
MMKTVVITGLGICVPGYNQRHPLFDALYHGRSLLQQHVLDAEHGHLQQTCSPMAQDQLLTIQHHYSILQQPQINQASIMGLYAADQAVQTTGLTREQIQQAGIFVGCNKTLMSLSTLHGLWQAQQQGREAPEYQHVMDKIRPQQCAETLAAYYQNNGPAMTYGDACTAGATAIISGMRRIQHGNLDVAICGATEHATHPLMQLPFFKLGALSTNQRLGPTEVCRPFDKDRSGCLLADGAAFVVMESLEHALKRGVKPLAKLSAGVRQSEAHKFTSTESDGKYYAKCMSQALLEADLSSSDIDHISAHGTSTPSNDQAESRAINQLFRHDVSVTSTKSALGHSLGASGAIEAVLSVLSLENQQVLPTLNFNQPGKDEPLLNIVKHGQPQKLQHVLSNSFGFGGENATLIFSRAN